MSFWSVPRICFGVFLQNNAFSPGYSPLPACNAWCSPVNTSAFGFKDRVGSQVVDLKPYSRGPWSYDINSLKILKLTSFLGINYINMSCSYERMIAKMLMNVIVSWVRKVHIKDP